jgi:hypothetical protein
MYSPNFRLEYSPLMLSPSPFPSSSTVEDASFLLFTSNQQPRTNADSQPSAIGLHLSLAPASLVRRAMNAFYADLKVSVHTFPPPNSRGPSTGGVSMSCSSPGSAGTTVATPSASPSRSVAAARLPFLGQGPVSSNHRKAYLPRQRLVTWNDQVNWKETVLKPLR